MVPNRLDWLAMAPWKGKLAIRGVIFALLAVLIFLLSGYGPEPLTHVELAGNQLGNLGKFYSSQAWIAKALAPLGPYSSGVFILLQALQVVISPVPGEITGFVGGYLYGETFGFVLSTIGLTLGSWMAFELARILGRPLVERFVSAKVLDKFRFLSTNTGTVLCFLLFAFPGFPKDSLCYVLGMSRMRLSTFIVVSAIGRMPGTYVLSLQGASVQTQQYTTALVIVGFAVLILLVAYLYRAALLNWIKNVAAERPAGR